MKMYRFFEAFNILGIFYLFYVSIVTSFDLQGHTRSYAKFKKWRPCQNGSIQLEFKTRLLNTLILYTDDSGYTDYFVLKLLAGKLHLRFKLGRYGELGVSIGQNLADNQWHKIFFGRNGGNITLSVDNEVLTHAYYDRNFGKPSHNNPVFIGGISWDFADKTKDLTLPSIFFEPRFKGSVRNILYSECGGPLIRPELLQYEGIVSSNDHCVGNDPCQHGGICLTQNQGISCNCSYTDYEGEFCEIKKTPSEVTFFGSQYFTYDWSAKGEKLDSDSDEVNLYFRTRQPSGLLFYTGSGSDFIMVALNNGGVKVIVDLGSGKYEGEISPRGFRFDDNHWHHVILSRVTREVTTTVDGTHRESGTTSGEFTQLSSNVIYVGGSPPTLPALYIARNVKNFKGCMKKVLYRSGGNTLDLTNLAITRSDILQVHGEVAFNKCHDIVESQPITFTTPDSYILLPSWEVGHSGGSLSFTFQTNEPNGVIMYNSGRKNSDFFAFEILDQYLYLIMDLGSGAKRFKVTSAAVSDGKPHEVFLEHIGRKGWVTFDGQRLNYTIEGENSNLDMVGMLYVGGINNHKEVYQLPKEMWAGMLGHGFVGCMQDLVINGDKMDLLTASRKQGRTEIATYCRSMDKYCVQRPCINNGVCSEGWNRYICDCRATSFVGTFCQTDAATLEFDGAQFMKITIQDDSHTEAEDISLRFRTTQPNGLLFMTSSDRRDDSMALYLERGLVKLEIRVGSGYKMLTIGRTALNNDMWHTVFVKRRERHIELSLDSDNPITDALPASYVMGLYVKYIVLGSPGPMLSDTLPRNTRHLALQHIEVGQMVQDDNMLRRYSGFVGSMQQFIFNGNHFFEMAKAEDLKNIEVTAHFDTDEPMLRYPVTFKSKDSYLQLPKLEAYMEFSIYFKFKTTEQNGLIMYNGGIGNDFIAFELQAGYLHYVYNTGGGARRVVVNTVNRLNDNEWHNVRLLRPVDDRQTIRIDDQPPTLENVRDATSKHFNLMGNLYIGGVSKTMFNSLPKLISSRHGFQGCMASLDLNGPRPNLIKAAVYKYSSVVEGCQAPSNNCHEYACRNQGRCMQQWNTYSCDCDMTSFTGPTCTDDSIYYSFGPRAGVIVFTLPESKRPNTKSDQLALGFRSVQESAVLIRVESIKMNDYIEVQLDKGNVFVVYNMGTENHPIGQLLHKHNDNKYHVIRFTRSGPNATLQIDDGPIRRKNPLGSQLNVFNDQARIFIGGYKNNTGVYRQFNGIIQGLVFNGLPLLELASKKDSRISVFGRVTPHIPPGPKKADIQSTMGVRLFIRRSTAEIDKQRNIRENSTRDNKVQNTKFNLLDNLNIVKSNSAHRVTNAMKSIKLSSRKHTKSRQNDQQTTQPTTTLESPEDISSGYSDIDVDYDDWPSSSGFGGKYDDSAVENPNFWGKYNRKFDSFEHVNQQHSSHEGESSGFDHSGNYDYEGFDIDNKLSSIPSSLIDHENAGWKEIMHKNLGNRTWSQRYEDSRHTVIKDKIALENERQQFTGNMIKHPSSGRFPKDRGKSSKVLLSAHRKGQNTVFQHPELLFVGDKKEKRQFSVKISENYNMSAEIKSDTSRISTEQKNTISSINETKTIPGHVLQQNHTASSLKRNYSIPNLRRPKDNNLKSSVVVQHKHHPHKNLPHSIKAHRFLNHKRLKSLVSAPQKAYSRKKVTDKTISSVICAFKHDYDKLSESHRSLISTALHKEDKTLSEKYHHKTVTPLEEINADRFIKHSRTGSADNHTTPRQSTTDEIIHVSSGDGINCPSDDEDDCTSTGSGSSDDIITPIVIIATTPKPPSTKPGPKATLCDVNKDHECKSQNTDFEVDRETDVTPTNRNGPKGNQYPIDTSLPTKEVQTNDSNVTTHNIALIIGIVAVVVVALIILIIALYKFHRRDEGTYKVDESQNFAYLEGKKQNGNGTLLGAPPGNTKTGKKKDVKEWYV